MQDINGAIDARNGAFDIIAQVARPRVAFFYAALLAVVLFFCGMSYVTVGLNLTYTLTKYHVIPFSGITSGTYIRLN